MDVPFKKERKTEIGVDMTPGRIKKTGDIPEFKLGNLLRPVGRRGGGGFKPSNGTDAPEADSPLPVPAVPRFTAESSAPSEDSSRSASSAEKSTADKSHTAPKSRKSSFKPSRRCIVKVDYRNISTPAGKKSQARDANRRMVSARLMPFMKPDGSTVGAQVGYIKREDAIEGCLFNYKGNGLQALDEGMVVNEFDNRPTLTIILSPEDEGMDLYELTKRFMKDIYIPHAPSEPLFWCAAIHGNTEHKHVHIILSAEDIDGNDARIDRNYVHSGSLQKDTADILNDMSGYRTWKEQLALEKKAKNKLSFTWTDKTIFSNAVEQEDGTLKLILENINKKNGVKDKVSRRLQVYKKNGLAKNTDDRSGTWFIQPGTEERLRRQDFVDAFGLTEADFDNMIMDTRKTPAYAGTIIETAVAQYEMRKENSPDVILFMIKEQKNEEQKEGENVDKEKETEKIHLRREYVNKGEIMPTAELENVGSVTKEQIKAGIIKGLQLEKGRQK